MGATHHDDVVVLLGLLVQGVTKLGNGRVKTLVDGCDDGDVHRGGEGVVGRLATVDVVVGVHGGLGPQLAAGQFDGAVADDLVGVHVRLGARAGLEDDQRELGVELAGNDLVSSLDDEVCHVARELTELLVGQGGGFLQSAQGTNHVAPPHEGVATDLEVVEGTLGLGSPVVVCRHVNGAHAVFFSTHLCHGPSLLGNEAIGASGWRDFWSGTCGGEEHPRELPLRDEDFGVEAVSRHPTGLGGLAPMGPIDGGRGISTFLTPQKCRSGSSW